MKNQRSKLIFLGIPLLVLVFSGMTATVFVALNLIMQGVFEGAVGQILVGGIILILWMFMALKTVQARRRARN